MSLLPLSIHLDLKSGRGWAGEDNLRFLDQGIRQLTFRAYALCFPLRNESRSISHEVLSRLKKGKNTVR